MTKLKNISEDVLEPEFLASLRRTSEFVREAMRASKEFRSPIEAPQPDDVVVTDLQQRLDAAIASIADYSKLAGAAISVRDEMKSRLASAEMERDELRIANRALENALERTKGYIDRVLELEDASEKPRLRQEPLPSSPKGPCLKMDVPVSPAWSFGGSVAVADSDRRY